MKTSSNSRNKKKFILPVTPFTRKILISKYGLTVDVNQKEHPEICTLLQLDPIINVENKKKHLTDSINFSTRYNLYNAVKRTDIYALGVTFHTHHIYKMYEFIYLMSEVANAMTALDALKLFYQDHNLNDDDFDMDSAYRGWVRYKKDKKPLFTISELQETKETVQPDFTFDVMDALAQFQYHLKCDAIPLKMFNVAYISISRLRLFDAKTIEKVQYFLLHVLCEHSYQQIANRVNRPKTTVRYHIKKAPDYINKNEEAAFLVTKILQSLNSTMFPVLYKSVG